MKVAEIAEFRDMRDELEAMSVAEVVIQSIVDDTRDPPIAWQSVVILATPDARFFTPWVLAVRPSESDARRAVVELLRGIVEARRTAQQCAPAVDGWNAVLTTQRAMRAVDAWRQQGHDDAAPAVADVRPVPLAHEAPAVPPPVPRYDETEYERWRADVRATREQRRLTQVELASKAGTTPSHISRIERGVRKPPLVLAQAISDALDLRPPPVSELPGAGAGEADPGTGVLRHSGSNGAVAAKRD
jgi:DNA-binding XRE family transcriptional regulator